MTEKAKVPGGKWAAQVPDFARRIGEAAGARRVVLFGSAARGEMGKHSDLDFLVVIPDGLLRREAWKRANRAILPLYRAENRPPSMDILVRTEGTVRRRRDCVYSPIKFALDEGVEVWRADGR